MIELCVFQLKYNVQHLFQVSALSLLKQPCCVHREYLCTVPIFRQGGSYRIQMETTNCSGSL